MTCKTGQNICVSVRPYDVNIFKNTRLRYRWANVSETWYVYSMGQRQNV